MKLCVVAAILLASVYSTSSAQDGECQYVYIAQPPANLNCDPSGDSTLQLACSLYLGDEIIAPGALEFHWLFSPLNQTASTRLVTSVQFDAKPRQNFISKIVVLNPPPGFYFCQPRNEHINLSISTVAEVLVNESKPPCVIGQFAIDSTLECAQQNFTEGAAIENISATANNSKTEYVNMGVNTTATTVQPTSNEDTNTPTAQTNNKLNLQLWVYIMIGAVAVVVFMATMCVFTMCLICCTCIRKRRNNRKTKFVKSRQPPNDRYTNSPSHTTTTTESIPLNRDITSTTNSTTQLVSKSNLLGQNIPPPPSNPPPVLRLQEPEDSLPSEHFYQKLKFNKNGRTPNRLLSMTSTSSYVDGNGYILGPGRREGTAGLHSLEEDGEHSTEYLSIKRDSDYPRGGRSSDQ